MLNVLYSVFINVLTVLIPAALTVMLYTLAYYYQRSELMKNIRRFINPRNRVLVSENPISSVKISNKTEFNRILTEEEQKVILSQDAKRTLFNGDSVRLDDLAEDGTAIISVIGFFDFMTTNLVLKPSSRSKKSIFASLYASLFSDTVKEANRLERRVKASIYGQPKRTFRDVLQIRELANIIAVSVVIKDCSGRVLVIKRGNKVAISSGNFAVACTGSVAKEDLDSENPFVACAKRELREELNINCDLHIDNVIISKQKLQPAVLLSGAIDTLFEDVLETMFAAADFNAENSQLFAVPENKLNAIVKCHQFTDVAAFQLAGKCKHWITTKPASILPYELTK